MINLYLKSISQLKDELTLNQDDNESQKTNIKIIDNDVYSDKSPRLSINYEVSKLFIIIY